MGIVRALTRNRAATAPDHPDPRLRGRRYAIPFRRVWEGALALADGGLRGWRLTRADEAPGEIRAEATTRVFRFVDDVEIRIRLDPEGQTRVDATSASRVGRADLGTNARRLDAFLRALDRQLEAAGSEILPVE